MKSLALPSTGTSTDGTRQSDLRAVVGSPVANRFSVTAAILRPISALPKPHHESTDGYTLKKLNNRMHRRTLIIDGVPAFAGGVGVAEVWTGNAKDPEHLARAPLLRKAAGRRRQVKVSECHRTMLHAGGPRQS